MSPTNDERPMGISVVKASVADARVEHEVKLMDFTKWLEKNGGSPREVSDGQKIRSILGMPIHMDEATRVAEDPGIISPDEALNPKDS